MQSFSRLTELLANLDVKHILVAVAVLLLLLALSRLAAGEKGQNPGWLVENLQVVLSVVVVVFLIIRPFLFQAFYIPSSSMEPTLMGPKQPVNPRAQRETSGDRLLVNKLIYRISDPRRGDIAVFKAPPQASADEKEFIKRVVGLPGETVEVVAPRLLVDGRAAFALSAEGAANSLAPVDRSNPAASVSGNTAELSVGYDGTCRVVAYPAPGVEYAPDRVEVNGKVELRDPEGRIQQVPGLTGYGADPSVQGTLYTVDGQPRLAVLTGSVLTYAPSHVEVNGRPLDENYIAEAPHYAMAPVTLKRHEYFMMGDNRNQSLDSHEWGPLTRDRIIGRAELLFWPGNRFRVIDWWLLSLMGGLFIGYNFLQRLLGVR